MATYVAQHGAPRAKRAARAAKPVGIGRMLLEVVLVLALALGIATAVRHLLVQVYKIPSGSMEPTLMVGDRIVANKIPVVGKQLERGDVVVFSDKNDWMGEPAGTDSVWTGALQFLGFLPADGQQILVKRVIGVGGDTVACCTADGSVTVNGSPIDEPYISPNAGPSDIEFSQQVPADSYWVMGDNRSNSADSRLHIDEGTQFVGSDQVVGRVWSVIWPFSHWSSVGQREQFAAVPDAG